MRGVGLIFVSLLMSSQAWAQGRTIVDYAYGNQIQGSLLSIDEDGLINYQERTCCPPTYLPVRQDKLSAPDLQLLKEAILHVLSGQVTKEPCMAAMGGQYGHLSVTSHLAGATESKVVLSRNLVGEVQCESETNSSSAAKTIQFLVHLYVKSKMPSLP